MAGLWTRSLIILPDGTRDETSAVTWLQGPALYADLRVPAGRPDFHAADLGALSFADCQWLATQHGFAGLLSAQDGVFSWHREIDFQPPAPLPDAGRLFWEGGVLVETGHHAAYREHWHRSPDAPARPAGALRLQACDDGRAAILVRAGAWFMFARARGAALLSGRDLAGCVAAASLAEAQALVDCELSLGEAAAWRIARSTLPFREGAALAPRRLGSRLLLAGAQWDILMEEGETGI
jgi:hypothetical protein